jgi:hypothetical protein
VVASIVILLVFLNLGNAIYVHSRGIWQMTTPEIFEATTTVLIIRGLFTPLHEMISLFRFKQARWFGID